LRQLLLARHGESEYSAKQLVNGDPGVSCPLTEAGREQARALGRILALEQIDLCAVTEFERVRETAELALVGRDVPFVVVPELNDPRYGEFEGGSLDVYREWIVGRGPLDAPPGGEHRAEIVRRYAAGFRALLDRPEGAVLLVAHSLPIAYLRDAASGTPPRSRMNQVDYATVLRLERENLERALVLLEGWIASPAF
jgi:2,3-bisphosphoglycerate-dependent phosphoglycerate mutase